MDGVSADNLRLAILGADRKALAEYGRKTLAAELKSDPADLRDTIAAESAAILAHAEDHCRSLILLYEAISQNFKRSIPDFQALHPVAPITGHPPCSESKIVSAFQKSSQVTSAVSQKLLVFLRPPHSATSDLKHDNLSEAVKTAIRNIRSRRMN